MRQRKHGVALIAVVLMLVVVASGCPSASKTYRLTQASNAAADGLANAQETIRQGVAQGLIAASDSAALNTQFARVAQAGLALDKAVRANESAGSVQTRVNVFIRAFNDLAQNGVLGIKNDQLRLTVQIALQGAQGAVAIIVASLGG